MGDAADDLAALWRWFADEQFRGYSPLYERIAEVVAGDRELLGILRQAPPAAHLPPAPLGAVRYLLLAGLDHPLGEVYAGRSAADPGPLFADVCRRERDALLELLETRRVQTNDCGRSALIGPALTWVAERIPGPLCLVDVGTSAGINLLCDRFRLSYGPHGATGPPDSTVHVTCEVSGGRPPVADRLPALVDRVGIDLAPLDLTDPADARWLLACVWPDTGRSERVEASIHLARRHPPRIVAGRANEALPAVLAALPANAAVVVTTTWAFGYFPDHERTEFAALLASASHDRPIAWVSAEMAGTVEALAGAAAGAGGRDVLGAVRFDGGRVRAEFLAYVHPHGHTIDWRATD